MRMMHIQICARCGKVLDDGACTGESQLYSPNRAFTLCEPCWIKEDAEIEDAGTNVLPEILSSYALAD